MRIINEVVTGHSGVVQIQRTEDSAIGTKFIYEEMQYLEFARTIQLLSTILLQEVAKQSEADGRRLAAREAAAKLENPGKLLWPEPGLCSEMLYLVQQVEYDPASYQQVLKLPATHEVVRACAVLLHQGSYRWMQYRTTGFPDLFCLLDDSAMVRVLRGLQPFFKAAARRGDSYDTTAAMGVSGGKYLSRILRDYGKQAAYHDYADELASLERWAGYLVGSKENPVQAVVTFTL